ncbi:Holliday junction branch migration protein RuvA [bacterium]|nr:Holliday junction branch migration protein RuvA [candidate division CSSED10-310 bacterium]
MIGSIEGTLIKKSPESILVSTAGIGLIIHIPLSTFYALPEPGHTVFLHIHMLVREDSIRLFGFQTESELDMFKILIDVNRIGPKLALAILSGVTAADLQKAVLTQDQRALTGIPGIGKKSAERILFEIRDKLEQLGQIDPQSHLPATSAGQAGAEVVGVLVNLGYRQKDAEYAVEQALSTGLQPKNVDDLIRIALKVLSGRQT